MQQHEEDVKRKLYRTLLATFITIGIIFVALRFFATDIGMFFGLISKASQPKERGDILAPSPPYFYNVPETTNKANIALKGFSESGSKVIIYANGPETTSVVADPTGTFSAENIPLIEGNNTIYAKAEDSYQNQSEKSTILEIVYDKKKPKITVVDPKNGAVIKNLNQRILLKGTLDEKCEVRVNDMLAITKPDNSFEILLGVKEGKVDIKIEATDRAGNKSVENISVTYVKSGV